uniref:Uncharacterized protein n=1 Tax=Panagrolaimus sp. PS1159 TaxID=55785 RepID=A0AC35EWG6_9BILA
MINIMVKEIAAFLSGNTNFMLKNSLKYLLRIAATFKPSDFEVSDKYDKKKKLEAWNKSAGFSLQTLTLNEKAEKEAKKKWKKDSLLNANSSTLSLHICAYENSKELTKFDTNPFEFPRQQENDKITEPEVGGFRSSQRLLRSNQSTSSNNVRIPTAVANSPMMSSNRQHQQQNPSSLSQSQQQQQNEQGQLPPLQYQQQQQHGSYPTSRQYQQQGLLPLPQLQPQQRSFASRNPIFRVVPGGPTTNTRERSPYSMRPASALPPEFSSQQQQQHQHQSHQMQQYQPQPGGFVTYRQVLSPQSSTGGGIIYTQISQERQYPSMARSSAPPRRGIPQPRPIRGPLTHSQLISNFRMIQTSQNMMQPTFQRRALRPGVPRQQQQQQYSHSLINYPPGFNEYQMVSSPSSPNISPLNSEVKLSGQQQSSGVQQQQPSNLQPPRLQQQQQQPTGFSNQLQSTQSQSFNPQNQAYTIPRGQPPMRFISTLQQQQQQQIRPSRKTTAEQRLSNQSSTDLDEKRDRYVELAFLQLTLDTTGRVEIGGNELLALPPELINEKNLLHHELGLGIEKEYETLSKRVKSHK